MKRNESMDDVMNELLKSSWKIREKERLVYVEQLTKWLVNEWPKCYGHLELLELLQ